MDKKWRTTGKNESDILFQASLMIDLPLVVAGVHHYQG